MGLEITSAPFGQHHTRLIPHAQYPSFKSFSLFSSKKKNQLFFAFNARAFLSSESWWINAPLSLSQVKSKVGSSKVQLNN